MEPHTESPLLTRARPTQLTVNAYSEVYRKTIGMIRHSMCLTTTIMIPELPGYV